jgi:hypothetical protein
MLIANSTIEYKGIKFRNGDEITAKIDKKTLDDCNNKGFITGEQSASEDKKQEEKADEKKAAGENA